MTAPCDLTGPYAYDLSVVVLWVESIADVQAPTSVEIATGVSLQPTYNLTDIIGWEVATDILDDDNWGPFVGQRMGQQTIADSQLMFASDADGSDIRTLWVRGDVGYIVILPAGPYIDNPTQPVNVYPVRVAQLTQLQRLREPSSRVLVSFAVTERVGENVIISGP